MNFLQAIFFGIVQGLTEFIPVSSSGHLVLAKYYFGLEADLTFDIFMHLGTLLAVFIFFRKQIWELIHSLFCWKPTVENEPHRKNRVLIVYLLVATFVTGVFYLIFKDPLKQAFQSPLLVSFMLIITGALIFVSDFVKNTSTPSSSTGFLKSAFIGLAQGLSMIPGISRSGSTITAALFCGMKRKDAAHFSFLLSIPIILGANLVELPALLALDTTVLGIYLAGFVASFAAGYLVIAALIRLIQAGSLKYFAYYVWVLALFSIGHILLV